MKRLLLVLIATFLAVGSALVAPHHTAANVNNGCCLQASIYMDPQGSEQIDTLCVYGQNQYGNIVWDCESRPLYALDDDQWAGFPNYWWQSGPNTEGQGYVIVYMYYDDGTYYGVHVVVPWCGSNESWFSAYSFTGDALCGHDQVRY